MSPSPKLQAWFDDYGTYHTTPGNKRTHQIGIPMIVVAVLGLFAKVSIGPSFNLGLLLLLAAWGWYLTLDRRVAALLILPLLFCYVLGALVLPVWMLWVLFIGGWIIQYVGHLKYEKRNPAFYQNLRHLLIGPVWVFHHTFLR